MTREPHPDALDPANRVTLTVNGRDFGGWLDVAIGAGIERQARDFTVAITRGWPGAPPERPPIQQGDAVAIRIGADKVLSGYVFATPRRYDPGSIAFGIAGRSRTADLVDCSAINKPGQWRGLSVLALVAELAKPYGIPVVSEVGPGPIIADHTIQPGETVFESIDRLLKLSGMLSSDDVDGRLVLARVGSGGRAVDALRAGENILDADAAFDFAEVFSEYVVKGQSAASDQAFGAASNEIAATVLDPRIRRRRVLMLQESGNLSGALAQQRAAWERDNRLSRALTVRYSVQGWRQSDGRLWRPNQIVAVDDAILGLSRDMVISEITYRLTGAGTVAELTVAPPEGLGPEPADPESQRKKTKKKRKKGGKPDEFEYLIPADWEKNA